MDTEMKITDVRTATDAANALATAFSDATTPVTVTVTYLDASGRVVVASHVVGVSGWSFPHADNDVTT